MPVKDTDTRSCERTETVEKAIAAAGLYKWQVADALGVSNVTLRNWMRGGMSEAHYLDTMERINTLCKLREIETGKLTF